MPRYKVLRESYINDEHLPAGAVVEYAGKPGSNLEALDAPTPTPPVPHQVPTPVGVAVEPDKPPVEEPAHDPGAVEIPDDWRDGNGLARIALAKRIDPSQPRTLKGIDADSIIVAELARRAGA